MNFRGRRITAALLAGGTLLTGVGVGSAIAATSRQADTNGTATTQQQRPPRGAHQANPAVTAAVKSLLGVDDAALAAAKTAKQSLTQLAATKNVAKADLVAAIAAALKANKPVDAPTLTDAQLTDMATHIADEVPGAHTDRGPRGGNDAHRTAVEAAIAQAIGVTSAELQAARDAGTSPVALAAQHNVDRATLLAATVAALKANAPTGAPARTDAQVTTQAGNIIDNARPPRPAGDQGPGGRHDGPPPAQGSAPSGGTTASSNSR